MTDFIEPEIVYVEKRELERLRRIERAAWLVSTAAIDIEAVRYAYGAPKNGSALFQALGELDHTLGRPGTKPPDDLHSAADILSDPALLTLATTPVSDDTEGAGQL